MEYKLLGQRLLGSCYLPLVNGCLEYHRPIITKADLTLVHHNEPRNYCIQGLYVFFLQFLTWGILLFSNSFSQPLSLVPVHVTLC